MKYIKTNINDKDGNACLINNDNKFKLSLLELYKLLVNSNGITNATSKDKAIIDHPQNVELLELISIKTNLIIIPTIDNINIYFKT